MTVRCPRCGAPVEWESSEFRPFCSERCKLIDLGAWIGERYAIPGEPLSGISADSDGEEGVG